MKKRVEAVPCRRHCGAMVVGRLGICSACLSECEKIKEILFLLEDPDVQKALDRSHPSDCECRGCRPL